MKQKRFNVEQIVAVLKQAEAGVPLAELIGRVGISEQTYYRWKKQYVGLEVDQVRQLKQLQEENTRLKQLVADLTLDKAMLQDVLSKKGSAQEFVKTRILGCFLKNDEFGLCDRHALSLQQQIGEILVTTAPSQKGFDVAVDGFHHAETYFGAAVVQDPVQVIHQHLGRVFERAASRCQRS